MKLNRVCGIYRLFIRGTDLCYVGQSSNVYLRAKNHLVALLGGASINQYLAATTKTYPHNLYEVEILELCNREDLLEREWFWIATLKPPLNHRIPDLELSAKTGRMEWTISETQKQLQSKTITEHYASIRRYRKRLARRGHKLPKPR